jgi:hypothetical protein
MRIFVASLRKLVRRPATFVTFGLLVGLLALIILAVSATAGQSDDEDSRTALLLVTFPVAYTFIVSFILGLGGPLRSSTRRPSPVRSGRGGP